MAIIFGFTNCSSDKNYNPTICPIVNEAMNIRCTVNIAVGFRNKESFPLLTNIGGGGGELTLLIKKIFKHFNWYTAPQPFFQALF